MASQNGRVARDQVREGNEEVGLWLKELSNPFIQQAGKLLAKQGAQSRCCRDTGVTQRRTGHSDVTQFVGEQEVGDICRLDPQLSQKESSKVSVTGDRALMHWRALGGRNQVAAGKRGH